MPSALPSSTCFTHSSARSHCSHCSGGGEHRNARAACAFRGTILGDHVPPPSSEGDHHDDHDGCWFASHRRAQRDAVHCSGYSTGSLRDRASVGSGAGHTVSEHSSLVPWVHRGRAGARERRRRARRASRYCTSRESLTLRRRCMCTSFVRALCCPACSMLHGAGHAARMLYCSLGSCELRVDRAWP